MPKRKKIAFGKFKLKRHLKLLNKLFLKKRRYKGFALKSVKGGFTTSVLGFRSFMPKSHSKRMMENPAPIERVIGSKLDGRRKKFSSKKPRITLNIVSSSKSQGKGVRLKFGQRFPGRRGYWGNVARIINTRMEKMEKQAH